jgi:hypothetical protein
VSERCYHRGGTFGAWCDPMRKSLNPSDSAGKGLSMMIGWPNDAPGVKAQLLGVVYRPKANAQGFVLNSCPWCGASLKFWPEDIPTPVEPVESPKPV